MSQRGARGGAAPIRGLAACRFYASFLTDPLRCLRETLRHGLVTAYGEPVAIRARERFTVVALGPECNRRVLGDPILFRTTGQGISGPHDTAQRRLRQGLTRLQGDRHARQRKLVMPAFQTRTVAGYRDEMVNAVEGLLDGWHPGQAIDLRREMRKLTLRVSSRILFRREDPERSEHLGEMIAAFAERSFSLGVLLFPVDLPGTPRRRLRRHAEAVEREVREMIAEKRARPGQTDVMAILVRARDEGHPWIKEDDLVGQGTILFGASYETMANTLTWTLFLLEQHPRVLSDLLDEIDATLSGSPPTTDDLARMPRLDAVIRESMRILPPVPYTIRTVCDRTRLGDYELRRGDRVVLSHYITQHLPEIWPRPRRFHPERWSEFRPGRYEYIPFSAGPRSCIGISFASQVLRIALSMLLARFRLTLAPGTRVDPEVKVTMGPKGGLPVVIRARDRHFAPAPVKGRIHELVDLPGRTGNHG